MYNGVSFTLGKMRNEGVNFSNLSNMMTHSNTISVIRFTIRFAKHTVIPYKT